ncbi:hypothetical protein SAY87_017314 [Trapa incisa]|uniref:40S ribosomal protein S30 n=1 Tax=Trapa incisa TaxID=236973 RepID=A0AAN7LDX6_9MYRT|nr:hypothetical protein SAY87_017314 [Trapa incisa]
MRARLALKYNLIPFTQFAHLSAYAQLGTAAALNILFPQVNMHFCYDWSALPRIYLLLEKVLGLNLELAKMTLTAAGKVHGSLARAGKVRGQTPKVAKQDKKKKPRGRAHKRMQYNRRFVTAVVGFGKKRGPNSSEK